MKKSVLAIGIAALIPLGVTAGGSHSDGPHHEAGPAHHQDRGHGNDHHASGGHCSRVGGSMPAFADKLSPPEVDAILAWVQSHWSEEIYAIWRERDLAASGDMQATR
jgi:mono/diheme cytochrome c family protein